LPSEGLAIANIYRYAELVGPWPDDEIYDLIDRDYIRNTNSGRKIYPDNLEVAEKFVDAVFATQSDFERFVKEYPSFVENFTDPRKGDIPLKAVDMERVEKIFQKKVTSKAEFSRLMTSLKWAKENDEIKMNIKNYLSGEIWKAHMDKMDDPPKTRQTIIN